MTGKVETAEEHDEGCTTPAADRDPELRLWCQLCGQTRAGDRVLWALTPTDDLWCPRCDLYVPHHPAPRDVVKAERCLCGACRTRRAFEEAGRV